MLHRASYSQVSGVLHICIYFASVKIVQEERERLAFTSSSQTSVETGAARVSGVWLSLLRHVGGSGAGGPGVGGALGAGRAGMQSRASVPGAPARVR